MNHHQPRQDRIPDDLVPNRAGYSNEQLAIRTLAEVVAQLVMHGPAPDTARRAMLATVADVHCPNCDMICLDDPNGGDGSFVDHLTDECGQ